MYLEIHDLASFSSVNLNRDDTNAIKTITFGGAKRQRVSSQCEKRATRYSDIFQTIRKNHGFRSKELLLKALTDASICKEKTLPKKDKEKVDEICKIMGWGKCEEAEKNAEEFEPKLVTLFFEGNEVLKSISTAAKAHWENPDALFEELKTIRKTVGLPPEIALFGRMAASSPDLAVDAAVQVAHSISVNQVRIEDDFYTAIDDLKTNIGSEMMGTSQIASPIMYRYACVNMNILRKNLGGNEDLALETALVFAQAFIHAVPTGKASSTAPASYPLGVLVSVGKRAPTTLANAFLRPVHVERPETGEMSLGEKAIKTMLQHVEHLSQVWNWDQDRTSLVTGFKKDLCPDSTKAYYRDSEGALFTEIKKLLKS